MSNDLIKSPNNQVTTISKSSDDHLKDVEYAKDNVQNLIETGMAAVQELAQLSSQSQNSLFYERFSVMLKTVSDMNKDFVDLSRSKKQTLDYDAQPVAEEQSKVTNNLFVGSTADFQQMMKQMKEAK